MDLIITLLLVVILVLAVFLALVSLYWHKTNQKINKLLEKGKIKDFRDILLSQKERNKDLEDDLKEVFLKIKNLEDISKKTLQKTGIVRFNPFNSMGGNQSFVIAILDDKNNGFIISSLFIKEGNSRVYAKSVKLGKSDYLLSKEEEDALGKAINSK